MAAVPHDSLRGARGRSPATRASQDLEVSVQLATRRPYVPHSSRLRRWAVAAYAACVSPRNNARPAEVTIRVTGAAESRRLNRLWRGKDQATNVLSFPGGEVAAPRCRLLLGDLVIAAPIVAREARELGKKRDAHWAHMVVHGILHLMGHDHEQEAGAAAMEALEVEILAEFGYPDPYHHAVWSE